MHTEQSIQTASTGPKTKHNSTQFGTLCQSDGTSDHRRHCIKLQEGNEGPQHQQAVETAFGKEFVGLAQGDIKTKTKGTNAIFIMPHKDIQAYKGKYTYAHICLNHCPQKEDPYQIWITAGGNLIKCEGHLSVQTADITTAKLQWNSVISTKDARYMCLDLASF
jgi:hypothetical protein